MKCFLCTWCKPEAAGPELGYVADVEHKDIFNATQNVPPDAAHELHGWRLIEARIVEGFIVEPVCWLVRRVLRCAY